MYKNYDYHYLSISWHFNLVKVDTNIFIQNEGICHE